MDSLQKTTETISLGLLVQPKLEDFAKFGTGPNSATIKCEPLPFADADYSGANTGRALRSLQGYDSNAPVVHRKELLAHPEQIEKIAVLDPSSLNATIVRADVARSRKKHDGERSLNVEAPLKPEDLDYDKIQRPLPTTERNNAFDANPLPNRGSFNTSHVQGTVRLSKEDSKPSVYANASHQLQSSIATLAPDAYLPVTNRSAEAGPPARPEATGNALNFDQSQFATSANDSRHNTLQPLAVTPNGPISRTAKHNAAIFKEDAATVDPARPQSLKTSGALRGDYTVKTKVLPEAQSRGTNAVQLDAGVRLNPHYHRSQFLEANQNLPILSQNRHIVPNVQHRGHVSAKDTLSNEQTHQFAPETQHILKGSMRDVLVGLAPDIGNSFQPPLTRLQHVGSVNTSTEITGTQKPELAGHRLGGLHAAAAVHFHNSQQHEVRASDASQTVHVAAAAGATNVGGAMELEDTIRPKALHAYATIGAATPFSVGNESLQPAIHLNERSSGAAVPAR